MILSIKPARLGDLQSMVIDGDHARPAANFVSAQSPPDHETRVRSESLGAAQSFFLAYKGAQMRLTWVQAGSTLSAEWICKQLKYNNNHVSAALAGRLLRSWKWCLACR
jgi:hypothetical protein